ncbi:MAG: LysR family transcriptional regulator [Proteobacteria bacterium]|nr:MAG: LysR family transcriptional regulator [Pseudomonadota bacterium]
MTSIRNNAIEKSQYNKKAWSIFWFYALLYITEINTTDLIKKTISRLTKIILFLDTQGDLMNYKQIESFNMFMLYGSVTQAASVMNKTQPAVSRLLSELEKSVGFPLFIRKRNHLVATPEALLFHKAVSRSFIGFEELKRQAKAIARHQVGEIVISTQPVYINTLFVPIFARFHEKHPDVCVKLHDDGHKEMLQRVSENRCDFALGITLNLGSHTLDVRPLIRCQAVCLLPAAHPLVDNPVINIQQLNGQRFIELHIGSPLRTRVDHLFLEAGIYRHIVAEARTMQTVCNIVESGCGIAIADPLVTPYLDKSKVVFRPLIPTIDWDIAIIMQEKAMLTNTERSFYQITRKEIGKLNTFSSIKKEGTNP